METEELKLRCFEAIIASSKAGVVEETAAAKSRAPARPATRAGAAPAVAAAGASTSAVAPKPAASAPAAPVTEVPGASAEAETPPAAVVASTSRDDEFGQPEEERETDDERLHATVIEVSKGRNDILYFHLDNGQIWRQNEARYYPYPKNSNFEVDITRGMMGEYRMRIGDNSRMVRIRRVK